MRTRIAPERLVAYRKTFGSLPTPDLKAIVEGRKPHRFSAETLEVLRHLLEERKGGGQALVQPAGPPNLSHALPSRRDRLAADAPGTGDPADSNQFQPCERTPRTKRRTLAGLGVGFVAALAALALPATRDELGWIRVADDEHIADEQAYLKARPAGRHASEARARIDRQAWSVAAGLDSIQGYQSYLRAGPEGQHVAEAHERIEALKWEASVAANTIRRFKEFLREYPDSQHAGEARLQIEAVARQQALAAIERARRIRSQLMDIHVLEGAGGDGTGRDWHNACKDLKTALKDPLTPGARIHVAAGLIQESVAIPEDVHLVCGYGRNAQGIMEFNPRSHRVWLMPSAAGVRSMTAGRKSEISGLWLGLPTSLPSRQEILVYPFCTSIKGSAQLELSGSGMSLETQDGSCILEDYDPVARKFGAIVRGEGSMGVKRGAAHFLARLDRAPF